MRIKNYHKKIVTKIFSILVMLTLAFGSVPAPASAVLYSPGETLNPACLPTDTNCGVTPSLTTNNTNSVNFGPTATTAGSTAELKFQELVANGTNYTGFKSPDALAANILYTLPSADGSSGQVLSTNAAGALSWVTSAPSQWTTSGSNIYYNTGNVGIGTAAPTANLSFNATTATINNVATNGALTLSSNGTGKIMFNPGTSGLVQIGNSPTQSVVIGGGAFQTIASPQIISLGQILPGAPIIREGLRFLEVAYINGVSTTGNNYVGFQSPEVDLATTTVWSLPSADGSSGQVLSTNAAGSLSWATDMGVTSLAAPSGSNANGGSITNNVLTLSLADAINPGLVSTSTQTFVGVKTFDGLLFNEGANAVLGFNYPDATYDRRLRITAGKTDTENNSQGASIDLHGNNHANAGSLDLVAGGATGALTFWTNNIQRAIVDASGNVGIGTVAPTAKLSVADGNILTVGTTQSITTPGYLADITYTQSKILFPGMAALAFNNDGTRMFIGYSSITPGIDQHNLSTSWDISTAGLATGSLPGGTATGLIRFNSTGTKLFRSPGTSNPNISQYTLSTPFDITTATYDMVDFSTQSQIGTLTMTEFAFSTDGAKLFASGENNPNIYEYTLSTPYDLSTVSYNGVNFSVAAQVSYPNGFTFNSDGGKLIVRAGTTLYQYRLDTPFNISVAVYDGVSSAIAQDAAPRQSVLSADNTKFYIVGNINFSVYQYSMTHTESITANGNIFANNIGIGLTTAPTAKLEITPTSMNAVKINPYGSSAGSTGGLQFMELTGNGSNYTGFKAPDSLLKNIVYALPSGDGQNGYALFTDGNGALSWKDGDSGKVKSIILNNSYTNIITSSIGQGNGYTNFSGGIGTGGSDSVGNAFKRSVRLTSDGNLVNIGSIQAGEMTLTNGGTFGSANSWSAGSNPKGVALGDLNGDGNVDAVTANYDTNNVSVLLGYGNGGFQTKVDYAAGNGPVSAALGDVNSDGKADIIVANNTSQTVSVLLNNGNGTFAAKADYINGGDNPQDAVLGDVNGDGRTDIVVANGISYTVSIFINNGNGTFAARATYNAASAPYKVALGDVNNDGKADIAVSYGGGSAAGILLNNGNGAFSSAVIYTVGNDPEDIMLGDVTGDKSLDIVTANYTSKTISVLRGKGDGTFYSKVDYSTGTVPPKSIALSDLNGDGKIDIVSVGSISSAQTTVSIYLNGSFSSRVDYSIASGLVVDLVLGDLNNDGKLDIVMVANDSTMSVLQNSVNTIFLAQASTGNIGVGTNRPGRKLDVSGDAVVDSNLLAQLDGGSYYGRVKVQENQLALSGAGEIWIAKGPVQQWFNIAMSSDGRRQVAVGNEVVYFSSDYGATWTQQGGLPVTTWNDIAMSGDGKYQTLVPYSNNIYISSDYGANWTAKDSARSWKDVVMSVDGKYQFALTDSSSEPSYMSSDYGNTWKANWAVTGGGTAAAAMSSDGKYQLAVSGDALLYISSIYGFSWSSITNPIASWTGVAMSSNGKYQTAVANMSGRIYTSSDYGATWTGRDSNREWSGIAMSADGKYQTATVENGQIYVSENYGATWAAKESNRYWRGIAMSSDGKYQATTDNNGQIFVSYTNSYLPGGNVGIGTTTPGSALDVKGALRLSGSTSGYVGLAPAAAAGSTTYTLPSADGASGQMLSTNGSGALAWATSMPSQWTTSGSNVYYNTGNVAIGTSTPSSSARLYIEGSAGNPATNLGLVSGNGTVNTTTVPGQTIIKYETVGASTFTPPTGVTSVHVLAVGGGGAGGSGNGGGGGAGRFVENTTLSITPGATLAVTVGVGGTIGASGQNGNAGGASSLDSLITAAGGGGGGGNGTLTPPSGGSGGGAGGGNISGTAGAAATITGSSGGETGAVNGYGNNGGSSATNGAWYSGGGGGGATAVGVSATAVAAGNGGAGRVSTITGTSVTYAGGGGGGSQGGSQGTGGSGGGGNTLQAGTANTGGGGGATQGWSGNPGSGGSGVVIVRFATQITAPANQALLRVTDIGGFAGSTLAFFEGAGQQSCIIAGQTGLSCSSDIALKKNIKDMDSSLGNVLALRPVIFDWNNEADDSGNHVGFIAQEVENIYPGLVVIDPNGKKALAYDKFVPILTKAIQELSAKIDRVLTVLENGWRRLTADELCLTDSTGALVCVTGDQLKNIGGVTQSDTNTQMHTNNTNDTNTVIDATAIIDTTSIENVLTEEIVINETTEEVSVEEPMTVEQTEIQYDEVQPPQEEQSQELVPVVAVEPVVEELDPAVADEQITIEIETANIVE